MIGFITIAVIVLAAVAFAGLYFSARRKLKAEREENRRLTAEVAERERILAEVQAAHKEAAEAKAKISTGTTAEKVAGSLEVLSGIAKRKGGTP